MSLVNDHTTDSPHRRNMAGSRSATAASPSPTIATRTIAGALDPCGFALDADDLGIGGQQRREKQRPVALTRTHVEGGTHLVESQPSRQQAQPVVVEPEVPLVVEVGSGVAIVGRAHRIYGRCSSVCDGAG